MKSDLYVPALILVLVPMTILSVDTKDTRLLRDPAISRAHIAFVYDTDLWVANVDGSGARRMTTARGDESNPVFSPDGSWIAFGGNYDGNTDVYVMPVEGGVPERLTWHPSSDAVQAFVPDGSAVMFRSGRQVFTNRYTQLFTVSRRRRLTRTTRHSQRFQGDIQPGWFVHRVHAARRTFQSMEELPRRDGLADIPLRRLRPRRRPNPATGGTFE